MKSVLNLLPGDGRILFITRTLRLFGYGFLSVVLVLFLTAVGLNGAQAGLLLTLTLVGDTAISLWLTTTADRIGRRRMLIIGAGLMIFAGILFSLTHNFFLLLIAATIGVISPSGNEVGPFLAIEQASLSQLVPDQHRTRVFAWYNLVGSFATALGALCGGGLSQLMQNSGMSALQSYQVVVLGYSIIGALLLVLFLRVGNRVEAPVRKPQDDQPAILKTHFGLHKSYQAVLRLSALFSLDAFAGGLVVQSMVAYWFYVKFGVQPGILGAIFFGANVLAGISALSAVFISKRIGLINTMVATHLPSNLLLMLVPLMPNLPLAITFLLLRFSISQMDVPTRQSYTMAMVEPDERSAAAGITGVARTMGAAVSPMFTGLMLANPALISLPFLISGGLKVIYDIILYINFRALKPPEELKKA